MRETKANSENGNLSHSKHHNQNNNPATLNLSARSGVYSLTQSSSKSSELQV